MIVMIIVMLILNIISCWLFCNDNVKILILNNDASDSNDKDNRGCEEQTTTKTTIVFLFIFICYLLYWYIFFLLFIFMEAISLMDVKKY